MMDNLSSINEVEIEDPYPLFSKLGKLKDTFFLFSVPSTIAYKESKNERC